MKKRQLLPEDLIFDKKRGSYFLPCGTYRISYVTFEYTGGDCWVAYPEKNIPKHRRVVGRTLDVICEKLEEKHPELFTNAYKVIYWK